MKLSALDMVISSPVRYNKVEKRRLTGFAGFTADRLCFSGEENAFPQKAESDSFS